MPYMDGMGICMDFLPDMTWKTQEQRQNFWSLARFVGRTIGTLHGTTSITGMGSLWEDEKGTFVHKKTLELPPTQDASHHQDFFIFSRESL